LLLAWAAGFSVVLSFLVGYTVALRKVRGQLFSLESKVRQLTIDLEKEEIINEANSEMSTKARNLDLGKISELAREAASKMRRSSFSLCPRELQREAEKAFQEYLKG